MISVSEAQAIIQQSLAALPPQRISLLQAASLTLAEDVYATIDIPAFVQSSMDGYAIRFVDKDLPLTIIGEIAAGSTQMISIEQGQAARIFTGAPLPTGADTVVMQEKVSVQNKSLSIRDEVVQKGSNVRLKGAEVKSGALAMPKGCVLSPAAIGFLAGIGKIDVLAYPLPRVSIIVTGNELRTPGTPLTAGQVYESNSYSLRAALHQAGVKEVIVFHADDNLSEVKNKLNEALQKSDLVLLTGGVSVGDYDFVVEAARSCSVEQRFHRVKQRPGKPLYFGTKGGKPVFGLPGNPSSVLSCFYNYVLGAIDTLANRKSYLQTTTALLSKSLVKPAGLMQFLKGHFEGGKANPLGAQESFQLSSFAQATCLICLDEERTNYTAGEQVPVILLPM